MKRIISVLTLLFVLMSMLPLGAMYAKAIGKFVVGKVEAVQGETVTVKIYTTDNPGIVSLKLMVSYDDSLLELTDITGGSFSDVSFGPLSANPIAVNWVDAVHPNNTTNGAVAKLTFKVLDTAPVGRTSITVTYDPDDVYDSSFNNVAFDIENGYIKIVAPGCVHADTTTYPAKPSTCTVKGNVEYTKCNDCGEIISGSDAKLPLVAHKCEWKTTSHSTCTESGSREYICTVCGSVQKTESISATGHIAGVPVVTEKSTCTEHGIETTYCTVCGEAISEKELPLAAHNYEWMIIKYPTCFTKGEREYTCTVCDDVQNTVSIDVTSHVENEGVITKQPTCTTQGSKTYSCIYCGHAIRMVNLNALGHVDGEWKVVAEATCTSDGTRVLKCARCDVIINQENISSTGHDYSSPWTVEIEPTCGEDGTEKQMCCVCSQVIDIRTIGITDEHDYNSPWVVETEPTFDEEGVENQYCSICNKLIDSRAIPVIEYEMKFTDVKTNHWFYDAVYYSVSKGYMNGMSETTFSPNGNIKREQFVLILANMAGVDTNAYKYTSSGMSDVPTGQWYSGAVAWAVKEGYVSGMTPTTFGRGKDITRAQLARLFYVYAEKNGFNVNGRAGLSRFADANKVQDWMRDGLCWAVDVGIISGMNIQGKLSLNPNGTATRAQAAVMLSAFDKIS